MKFKPGDWVCQDVWERIFIWQIIKIDKEYHTESYGFIEDNNGPWSVSLSFECMHKYCRLLTEQEKAQWL
jgi:hypothetical protein